MSGLSLAVGTLGAVLAGPCRLAAGSPTTTAGAPSLPPRAGPPLTPRAALIRVEDARRPARPRATRSYAPLRRAPAPALPARAGRACSPACSRRPALSQYRRRCSSRVNSGVCGAFLTFTGLWGVPYPRRRCIGSTVKQAALRLHGHARVLFSVGGIAFERLVRTAGGDARRPSWSGQRRLAAGIRRIGPRAPGGRSTLLVPVLVLAGFGAGAMAISFGLAKEPVPPRSARHGHRRHQHGRDDRHPDPDAAARRRCPDARDERARQWRAPARRSRRTRRAWVGAVRVAARGRRAAGASRARPHARQTAERPEPSARPPAGS
ncbi:MAG: hypothetical protein MZW92_24970 [Comamonadaceae bacterium]|nr:hypothetical protein [Comamonadaceae bacterium]